MKNLSSSSHGALNQEEIKEIKRKESERVEMVKNELLQKQVEVGQVRKLTVDRSTRLDDLNGAEIRITYVNPESGFVGFELTENNSPDRSEAIKGRPLMAEIRSLFNTGKKTHKTLEELEEGMDAEEIEIKIEKSEEERQQFRKAVEQKKIEVGKYCEITDGVFSNYRCEIIDIDYAECKIIAGPVIFGRQTRVPVEIDGMRLILI